METDTSALADILASLRLESSLISEAQMHVPFAVKTGPTEHAMFHALMEGTAVLKPDRLPAVELRAGDLVILPLGHGHVISDGSGCAPVNVRRLTLIQSNGIAKTRVGGSGPMTRVVCGTFRLQHRGSHVALMRLLPKTLVIRGDEAPLATWLDTNLSLLAAQLGRGKPGAEAVSTRVTDLLFMQALNTWLARADHLVPGWLGGLRDDQIAQALALVHARPAAAWTATDLAQKVGMSRSSFYRRFCTLVGEPPATYVTRWRMYKAADLLVGTRSLSIGEVGERVGYISEDAFCRAFRRVIGVSPSVYRRQERATA